MDSFWKPTSVLDRDIRGDGDFIIGSAPSSSSLPIDSHRLEILYALEKYQIVILVGETGSGKTTRLLRFLHDAGWTAGRRRVVCTQPRAVAAKSVSSRVAADIGVSLGSTVGYSVRFDDMCGPDTVIKYCTDGILLRETLTDPLLSRYSVVVIDEAHERTIGSDMLLGLLKKILLKRKDLRIVVSSATMDVGQFKSFFDLSSSSSSPSSPSASAAVVSVQGRVHPVDIFYLSTATANYLTCAVETALKIHRLEQIDGDILIFLPGAEEIHSAISYLHEVYDGGDVLCIPIYSVLSPASQLKVFQRAPQGIRKIVFGTNIAETSITLEGISFIVDCGLVKLNYFDADAGVECLICCEASQASMLQRAGRAGRTAPGKCYRLLPEALLSTLPERTDPEMQRSDITLAVLQLKALGVSNVLHFDFPSPPPALSMLYALEELHALGAINDLGEITAGGLRMAELPVHPRWARVLLASIDLGCVEDALTVAAMCSVNSPFVPLRSSASEETRRAYHASIATLARGSGDHTTLVHVYTLFKEALEQSKGQGRGGGGGGGGSMHEDGGGDRSSLSSWCSMRGLQLRTLCRAVDVRSQLASLLKYDISRKKASETVQRVHIQEGSATIDDTVLLKCIMTGFFANTAQLGRDGVYWTSRGRRRVALHPSSTLSKRTIQPEWVCFNEVIHTGGSVGGSGALRQDQRQGQGQKGQGQGLEAGDVYIRDVSAISPPSWILASL